ncbi:Fpg/Nei family DNA glycosylase [Antribacter gilvus]|uniref:Fpg/Nei family DNA glycosylase n=1 Tax=Antribacter gilvus TaxID=2304675 RepID=UPI000F76D8E5|nr:DNA-formamidopyrimidine glycosylase family protein [Antribacter gilvus]
MPELPEVQALTDFLRDRATGCLVADVQVASIAALKTFDPPVTALVGAKVLGTARHGKWLDVVVRPVRPPDAAPPEPMGSLDAEAGDLAAVAAPVRDTELHLVFHLSRGGWVRWSEHQSAAPVRPGRSGPAKAPSLALRVRFDDGSGFDLTEAGTRKRLAVHVVRDPQDVPMIATLGPDPLGPDFTAEVLASLLAAKNQQVKGLLRDQSAIAGIGNAYSDEILHAARFSPYKLTRTFTPEDTARLHQAIGDILGEAIAASSGKPAAELKDAKRAGMRVHGRAGLPCPVCGDTVREVSFADRSMQYCPTCQTGGQVLADRRMSRLLK